MWPVQCDKRKRGVTGVREPMVQRYALERIRQSNLRKSMSTLDDVQYG